MACRQEGSSGFTLQGEKNRARKWKSKTNAWREIVAEGWHKDGDIV
jgi:hypothetical protein